MLGLSLTKILFTILVIAAVWKGFALVGRRAAAKRASVADKAERSRQRRAQGPKGQTVELVPCPGCGAYVDARLGCERCGQHGGRPT